MARLILHGTIANPRVTNGGLKGQTDFHIKTTLRNDPAIKGKTKLVLPGYLPINDKAKPPHYLLFCDTEGVKLDPYRGIKVNGPESVAYVKKALEQNPKDPVARLAFYFQYLGDPDPEVSRDAFLEFAHANDADIARAGPKMDPAKLRTWLKDPKTTAMRISVYAMLLGYCGEESDTGFLKSLLDSKEERYADAADGILMGYILKKPKEGWQLVQSILTDAKKPLLLRLAVLKTLRFAHGVNPKESKPKILKAMKPLLAEPEMADLAIEDLRKWQIWDLTDHVVALFGKKGYESPLLSRAIIRYALCCPPSTKSKELLAARRKADPETVKDVEDGLKYEKSR